MAVAWNIISVGLIALVIAFTAYFWKRNKTKVKAALVVGVLLSVFDFILESVGSITGYWWTEQGIHYIGYVTLEIMIITLLGGMMWSMFLPIKRNSTFSIPFILISILYGVFLESKLVDLELFFYGGGWTSFHALAVYTMIIFLMHETLYWAYARFSGTKFKFIGG